MRKYKINLLSEKEKTLLDNLIDFSLNYLRYIIVITQLVVIIVFFYRLTIDQRIIDLRESVDQKKEIIKIVLPLLQQAEAIDRKTKEINLVLKNQKEFKEKINYLLSIFPETIFLDKLEIDNRFIKLTGKSVNPNHLQAFLDRLKNDRKFLNVKLVSIKKTEEGYFFLISLENYKN